MVAWGKQHCCVGRIQDIFLRFRLVLAVLLLHLFLATAGKGMDFHSSNLDSQQRLKVLKLCQETSLTNDFGHLCMLKTAYRNFAGYMSRAGIFDISSLRNSSCIKSFKTCSIIPT